MAKTVKKQKFIPKTKADFDKVIKDFSEKELFDAGLRIWDDDRTRTFYIYPAEWYDLIPEGYPVVHVSKGLSGKKTKFKRKKNDDKSFGLLSFGFIRKTKPLPF